MDPVLHLCRSFPQIYLTLPPLSTLESDPQELHPHRLPALCSHLCLSHGRPSRISEGKGTLRSECTLPPCPVPVRQLLPSSEGPSSCQLPSPPSCSLRFWKLLSSSRSAGPPPINNPRRCTTVWYCHTFIKSVIIKRSSNMYLE